MPNTDFRYEEFEGLLASYYLTLLCLKDKDGTDGKTFSETLEVLNGFAERHNVRFPEDAAMAPRPTKELWGQPRAFDTYFTLLNMMSSFWRDFGVGNDPKELDGTERFRLGRCILNLLHHHDVITAKFEEFEGQQIVTGILEQKDTMLQRLDLVLQNTRTTS